MRVWVLALTLTGCGFTTSLGNDAAGPVPSIDGAVPAIDAAPAPGPGSDASPVDSPPGQVCVGTFVRVCVATPPALLTLSTQRIETGIPSLCAQYTSTPEIDACVITGAQIVIPAGATVTVAGRRPLILLSTRGITISGTLDVASRPDRTGPAADTGPCAIDFMDPTTNRGGGGWGGSFGGPGGSGGNSPTGIGGRGPSPVIATALTGGCAGGNGANNSFGFSAGAGGHSGGAVLLIAAQDVSIAGVVNASGRGGSPGNAGSGGGGGGSGGMIVLDAAAVAVTGKCFANGGGGGEGGSNFIGHTGGESPAPNTVGAGGMGGNETGGIGGASAFGSTGASPGANGSHGDAVQGDGGGGGAGGGAGVIKIFAPDVSGADDEERVAPPPG